MDEKIKTWALPFPAKENPNIEKALFDWPIVLRYDVKVNYQLISRKFCRHEVFFSRAFAQPTKSPAHLYPFHKPIKSLYFRSFIVLFSLFVRVFAFQGHTKITLLPIALLQLCVMDLNVNEEIRHFHDDDIWLQLPEFISFLLSYSNLSIPLTSSCNCLKTNCFWRLSSSLSWLLVVCSICCSILRKRAVQGWRNESFQSSQKCLKWTDICML